jgi:hypothetical protein
MTVDPKRHPLESRAHPTLAHRAVRDRRAAAGRRPAVAGGGPAPRCGRERGDGGGGDDDGESRVE